MKKSIQKSKIILEEERKKANKYLLKKKHTFTIIDFYLSAIKHYLLYLNAHQLIEQ